MDKRYYSIKDQVSNFQQLFTGDLALTRAENATQILPPDTSFAVVVEVIERGEDESFYEASVTPMPLGLGVGVDMGRDNSLYNHYVAYFAVVGSEFRVYAHDGSLKAQAPAASVTAANEKGAMTVHAGGRKFRIEGPAMPVVGDKPFESKAMGFNNGLDPLFGVLKAQGANLAVPSSKQNAIIFGVFIAIFLIVFVFLVFASQHR